MDLQEFYCPIFQLYNGPVDNNAATLLKKLNELRRYYDKKIHSKRSSSETIIDIFRFCVRKDSILSFALNSDFVGFDFKGALETSAMDVAVNATTWKWSRSQRVNGCAAENCLHLNLKQH